MRGRPHHDKRRVVGLEPGLVELHEVCASDLPRRGFGARAAPGVRIGVTVAEDEPWKDPEREANRVGFLPLDLCKPLLLQAVDLELPECRVQDDVGEEIERRVELVVQRLERHGGHVES